jgi:hypothetical protein
MRTLALGSIAFAFTLGVLLLAASLRGPVEELSLADFAAVASGSALGCVECSDGEHCGCSAKSCSMPCYGCCSPGTYTVTHNPTGGPDRQIDPSATMQLYLARSRGDGCFVGTSHPIGHGPSISVREIPSDTPADPLPQVGGDGPYPPPIKRGRP